MAKQCLCCFSLLTNWTMSSVNPWSGFSMLNSHPSKPDLAAISTHALTNLLLLSRPPPRICLHSFSPASHSVMIVPSTLTPWRWPALIQPTGGGLTKRWEK